MQRKFLQYELEALDGLVEFAERELTSKFNDSIKLQSRPMRGRISVYYDGDIRLLNRLKTVTAAHIVETFGIPRPKALLGNQNMSRLLGTVDYVLKRNRDREFKTLRVSGAGADSMVFTRLKQEISKHTGLSITEEPANLQITIRPAENHADGWQVLIRTSSMPLSSREWRVCSFPGALNATIAHVMTLLANPKPNERILNLCCGSGTLMIERLEIGSARSVVGIDNDPRALRCAEENLKASGHRGHVDLLLAEAGNVPLPDASVDTIVADLPYGMLVGEGQEIEKVYRSALAEATRIAAPRASMLMITTRKSLFESSLDDFASYWERVRAIPVSVPYRKGYIEPNVYWLTRKS